MAPNGAVFFPTNPDLADILGDTDFDLRIFVFLICWIPDFQIPEFPDFQILGSWNQVPGYGWLRLGGRPIGGFWTALPDHRIQEIQGTRTRP